MAQLNILQAQNTIKKLTEDISFVKKKSSEYENLMAQRQQLHSNHLLELGQQIKKKETQIQKLCEQLKFLIVEHERIKTSTSIKIAQYQQTLLKKEKEITEQKILLHVFNQQQKGYINAVLIRLYRQNETSKQQIRQLTQKINQFTCKDIQNQYLKKQNKYFKDEILKISKEFDELSDLQDKIHKHLSFTQNLQKIQLRFTERFSKEKAGLKQEFQGKLEQKDKEIAKLLEFLKNQNNLKNVQQQKFKQQKSLLNEAIEETNKKSSNLTTELSKKNQQILKLNKKLNSARDQNQSLTILINSFKDDKKQCENLQKNNEYLRKVVSDTVNAKQIQIKSLKEQIYKLSESLKSEGSLRKQDKQNYKKQIQKLKQDNIENEKLKDQKVSLTRELKEKNEKCIELTKYTNLLKEKIQTLEQQKLINQYQARRIKQQLSEAKSLKTSHSSPPSFLELLEESTKNELSKTKEKKYPDVQCPHLRNGGQCQQCLRKAGKL